MKRAVRGALVLLGLALLFHRPVLRTALNTLAPRLASSAGYDLRWSVQGSFVSDLVIRDLELKGPPGAAVKEVRMGELKAGYSLWDLVVSGKGHFIKHLAASDVTVDVASTGTPASPDKTRHSGPLPALQIPELRLHNVNVRIAAPGGVTQVKGFSLELTREKRGILEVDEVVYPAAGSPLRSIHGATSLDGQTVSFLDVTLSPEVTVTKLAATLGAPGDAIPFDLALRSGEGVVNATGSLRDLDARPIVDVVADIQQVSDVDVRRWAPLPEHLSWVIQRAQLRLSGPPAIPRELQASLMLGGVLRKAGIAPETQMHLKATLDKGKLDLPDLSLEAGGDGALLSGSAELPPTWSEVRRISADVVWSINTRNVANLIPSNAPKVTGSIHGSGSLAWKEAKLASFNGSLEGRDLASGNWRLDTVNAALSTNAGGVEIKSFSAKLGDGNTITLAGSIETTGRQSTVLKWNFDLANPAAIAAMAGMMGPAEMRTQRFAGEGTLRFAIADLREQNYERLKADGRVDVAGLAWGERRLQDATLQFVQEGTTLHVKNLETRIDADNQAKLTGRLQFSGRQELHAEWKVDIPRFEVLSPWLRWRPDWPAAQAGTLRSEGLARAWLADLRAKDYSALTGAASVRLSGFQSAKASIANASIELQSSDGRLDLSSFDIMFDEQNRVTASGHVMLAKPGQLALDVDVNLPRLQALGGWAAAFHAPALEGGSALVSWQGEGSLFDGDIRGRGSVTLAGVKLADRPAFSLTLTTHHAGKKGEITELSAHSGSFRVTAVASVTPSDLSVSQLSVYSGGSALASGSVALPLALNHVPRPKVPLDPGRPLEVSLQAEKLDLSKAFESFGLKALVDGVVSGELALHGLLATLEGRVNLRVETATAKALHGKLDPARLQFTASLARNHLDFEAQADQAPLHTLSVTGRLPLDAERLVTNPSMLMDTPIEAHVSLPESDLSIVRRLVPAVAELQGTISANVEIRGPLRSPHWSGTLAAASPRMMLEKSPMDIKDLRLRVSFADKLIQLDEASVILAGGTLRASGSVDVTALANPAINLHLDANQALIVRDDTMSARADGAIDCTGSLKQAAITGRVELVRCRVFKEIEYLPLSLPNNLPPPPPPVRPRAPPQLPKPLHDWTFDVDIVTRDSIRLLGNVFNGSATVDLQLAGTGAAPNLVGEVSFSGARVRLPNSRLTITRGTLVFTEGKPFEPEIDAQGESLVGSYEVVVNAYGPALSPKVRFSSSPPLPENEIATLLATGSTAGDERSAASAAANSAAFTLLSKAYRSVFDKAAPKRYDEEPPRLTFSFSPLSTGTSQPGVSATYEVSPRLQATGAVTERGTFRGMLYYMLRLR